MKKRIVSCIVLLTVWLQSAQAITNDSLFNEICSIVDNNFYDSTFSGTDWPSLKQSYKKKTAGATTRVSFTSLINEMLSGLHASHTSYYTADDLFYYQLSDIFKESPILSPSICKAFPNCIVK